MELQLIYQEFAKITYYVIGVIALQIVGSGIFKLDENFTVKPVIGGGNKFEKTSRLVVSVLTVIFGYYFFSRVFDDYNTDFLLKFEYLLFPLFFALTSFFIFYLLKVNIRRRWRFPLVKLTLIPLFVFSIIFGVLLYYLPPVSLSS